MTAPHIKNYIHNIVSVHCWKTCLQIDMNSHINLQLAKSPREKFHTLPPETTAGTHSCQKRNLMKEKQRKSRGFCSHTHTPHTDMAQKRWRFPSLPINVRMYQSSHNRASETPQARQTLAKLKSEIQQIKPFRCKCEGGKNRNSGVEGVSSYVDESLHS